MNPQRIVLFWLLFGLALSLGACNESTVTAAVIPAADGDTDKDPSDTDRGKDGDPADTDNEPAEPPDGDADSTTPDGDKVDLPDYECGSSGDCRLGQICQEGFCRAGCQTTRDCPENKQCRPELDRYGRCVDCSADADCRDGYRCQDFQCRFHCALEADCKPFPATPHCQPDLGLCVACLTDANCSIGFICSDASCTEGCRSDRDCQAPKVCDPQAGAHGGCFECVNDTQCNGKICRNHACVIDCSTIDCPSDKPYCDPQTGTCALCLSKENCRQGQLCVSHQCQPGCAAESDCPDGLHCLNGTPYGKCVVCRDDTDCTNGLHCFGNTCRSGGCAKDGDCKSGEFCHPALATCQALPQKPCSQAADCPPSGFSPNMCDPLTRTCIASCSGSLGFLACLLGGDSGRSICDSVSGGCYECTDNSYCVGTPCRPLDNRCVVCTQDSECAKPDWHCNSEKGSCYECLNNSHCGAGKVCNDATNTCVECLQNSDCKQPDKTTCGKDKTCIPACQDECVKDKTSCDPAPTETVVGYRTCGDYDNDPCLEYGSVYACPSGQSCKDGACACINECTENQRRCSTSYTNAYEVCLSDYYTGCLYWGGYYCDTGKVCKSGTCTTAGARTPSLF